MAQASKQEIAKQWSDIAPFFNQLKADTHEKIPFQSLNLKPKGGVHNILEVYSKASQEERDYWGNWYLHASATVHEMADRHDIPFEVAAGVVAVLSPGNRWWLNARVADKLMFFWKNKALDVIGPLSSYPANIKKAISILETTDAHSYVTGPKVGVFYDSLVDPMGIQHDLVLDGHAVSIWYGDKMGLKDVPHISEKERDQIEADYLKAAKSLGITPQALQAVTWYIWRAVKKGKRSVKASFEAAKLLVQAAFRLVMP